MSATRPTVSLSFAGIVAALLFNTAAPVNEQSVAVELDPGGHRVGVLDLLRRMGIGGDDAAHAGTA